LQWRAGSTGNRHDVAYDACELFALPSGGEGFGLVFLEAMSHGKPVIGGAHGGTPETIEEGISGYLVQHGDVAQLALRERRQMMATGPLLAAAPYLIEQNYVTYAAEQHEVWAELVRRCRPQVETYACREYLEGYEVIGLQDDHLPNLRAITERLRPRTGWSTMPVSGFLPAEAFFEMLSARLFPTTTYLRGRDSLEYTPEPDIFHDVFGHVPMHAHAVFSDFVQHYGSVCARTKSPEVVERLGRLYWYTVEFGLIRQGGMIKAYGSGVISSHRECRNVIEGGCEIREFTLKDVFATTVKVDELQKRLFVIESFDQLYQAMEEAQRQAAEEEPNA
jgi:phenylalanine-4-hydroxylase